MLSPWVELREPRFLKEEFQEKLIDLRSACADVGIELHFGCTLRGPAAQAAAWCRSRTEAMILRHKRILAENAPILSSLLDPRFGELGPQRTIHLPGESWHQWGEAADVFAVADDAAIWEGSTALAIAEAARRVGLHHSLNHKEWSPRSRHWHVQLSRDETPLRIPGLCDSWRDVEAAMKKVFSL